MGEIAVLTRGLWGLRAEIEVLTGLTPVRWRPWRRPRCDAVAGWGFAPTTGPARRLARSRNVPYLAFEDGPLRSVRPGPRQPPLSMVMDGSGIYYRADPPSDLTSLLADSSWFNRPVADRAARAAEALRRLRLSKYNSGSE